MTEGQRKSLEAAREYLANPQRLYAPLLVRSIVSDLVEAFGSAPVKFGCHCDMPEDETDECVFINGDICDCIYATKLAAQKKDQTACEYWKPIKFKAAA